MSIDSVDPMENAFCNQILGVQLALAAKKLHKEVMAQRNEIIQAFIAKYGYEPGTACRCRESATTEDGNGLCATRIMCRNNKH